MATKNVIFPIEELIYDLFKKYNISDNTSNNLVSSYGEYFLRLFNVQVNIENTAISLSGCGFGHLEKKNVFLKILVIVNEYGFLSSLTKDVFPDSTRL